MTTLKQCDDREEWDDYVLDHHGHPLQLWGWGIVKSSNGWQALRIQLINDDKIIGIAQVLIKRLPKPFRALAYIPRGPIVDQDNRSEFLLELAKFIKKTYHPVALSIEPDDTEYSVPKSWKRSNNCILPSTTILLDLKKSEAELLNDMAKKTRQYIRKSAAEKMTIKTIKSGEDLEKVLGIYQETAKRAKFDVHSDQYYCDVFLSMGDNSQVFAAYVDDQPVAFLWIAISSDTAYELYGGMSEVGQQLRLNYALKWHAILKCKEWGLSKYDFGGLIDGGVKTFKMSWTNEETKLAGTFDRPLSPFYSVWNSGLKTGKKITRRARKMLKR